MSCYKVKNEMSGTLVGAFEADSEPAALDAAARAAGYRDLAHLRDVTGEDLSYLSATLTEYTMANVTEAMIRVAINASGRESSQWRTFREDAERKYGLDLSVLPERHVPIDVDFARYWMAIADRDYQKAALYGHVPEDWKTNATKNPEHTMSKPDVHQTEMAAYADDEARRTYANVVGDVANHLTHFADLERRYRDGSKIEDVFATVFGVSGPHYRKVTSDEVKSAARVMATILENAATELRNLANRTT